MSAPVTREHRLAALEALGAPPVIPGGNLDAWCTFGSNLSGFTTEGRLAQAIADAEARGRAAERADVLALISESFSDDAWWFHDQIDAGEHVAAAKKRTS